MAADLAGNNLYIRKRAYNNRVFVRVPEVLGSSFPLNQGDITKARRDFMPMLKVRSLIAAPGKWESIFFPRKLHTQAWNKVDALIWVSRRIAMGASPGDAFSNAQNTYGDAVLMFEPSISLKASKNLPARSKNAKENWTKINQISVCIWHKKQSQHKVSASPALNELFCQRTVNHCWQTGRRQNFQEIK